jgi:hypothetical protein
VRPKRFLSLLYVRCKPCTYIALTLKLSPNDRNEIPHDPLTKEFHLVRPRRFLSPWSFDTNCAPFLHRDYHYLQTDSNNLPLEPCHIGVSSGASKMISRPIVRSAQTVQLYCTDTNTISKQTKMRFHMTQSPRSSIGCDQYDF